jgi:homoserine dehydrogenase
MTKPLSIAIAGLGTVGAGVVKLLHENHDVITQRCGRPIHVVAVSARHRHADRGIDISAMRWEDNPLAFADADDIDVVVELIGGADGTAKALCEQALTHNKAVVTANKALIAHHGKHLAQLSATHHVPLAFEAAVAGGIPVIRAMRGGLSANRYSKVEGILNGTCNYILTMMEKTGKDFGEVLEEARQKGYAEADPTFDINGTDTAHKLAIVTALAFGTPPNMRDMYIEGIEKISAADIAAVKDMECRIKLLGIACLNAQGHVEQRVHPVIIPEEAPLATVDDVYNGLEITGNFVDNIFLEGRGAGAGPTASAVVSDIMDIARGIYVPAFGVADSSLKNIPFCTMDDVVVGYYLRLTVKDQPGVLSDVSEVLGDVDISVSTLTQPRHKPNSPVQIVITTHPVREASMREALKKIEQLECVLGTPQMIRMDLS